jgi:hypothetical protein
MEALRTAADKGWEIKKAISENGIVRKSEL